MKISKYLLAVMFSSFVLSACAAPTDDAEVTGEEAAVEDTMVKDEAADEAIVVDEAMKIEVGTDEDAAMDDEALD